MKCDELTSVTREYADEYWEDRFAMVYNADEVDAAIAELKRENKRLEEKILEYKAREDVLVTDNRNLLDKVKKLEERLHENAEHFKRNELQILENSDKVIAEKDKEIAELQKQVHDYAQGLYVIQARAEKEARHHKYKRCMAMADKCVDLCHKAKAEFKLKVKERCAEQERK